MGEIRIGFGENAQIDLEEVDVGVADGVVAFDVSGRITGFDDDTVDRLAGKRLIPTELTLETRDEPGPDGETP